MSEEKVEINPRIKRKVFLVCYKESTICFHDHADAIKWMKEDPMTAYACVPVTLDVEEGHGL